MNKADIIRLSLEKTQALLEHFADSGVTTTSTFHEKKTENRPSVVHGLEIVEFNSAKLAVDKDLGSLLGSRPSGSGDLIHSVHYADINGLSRLENNILAHEISGYLGMFNRISSYSFKGTDSSQPTNSSLHISHTQPSLRVNHKHEAGLPHSALCLQYF
jgi:hypothetical protein